MHMAMQRQLLRVAIVLGAAALAVGSGAPGRLPPEQPRYRSPLAVVPAPSGSSVLVAEYTGRSVAEVSLDSNTVRRRLAVALPPTGLAVDPVRRVLYVTGEAPQGRVLVIGLDTGRLAGTLTVGHTPVAPVLNPDGKMLYVCNRFNHSVSFLDVASARETARIGVLREPVASALSPDGRVLVVADHLPAMPANQGLVAAAVSLIDTADRRVLAHLTLPDGSTSLRGVCVAPDGKHAGTFSGRNPLRGQLLNRLRW